MRDAGERVRLTLASPSFFPAFGGAELRFRRYLPGLRERGIDVGVLTGTPKAVKLTRADREAAWYRLAPGEPVPAEPLDGCPVERLRLPDAGRERGEVFFAALLRHCAAPATRPDAVQILGSLPSSAARWLGRLRALGVPLVYAAAIAAREGGGLRARWQRRRRRRALDAFDAIVAPHAPLRDELRAQCVRARIEVIPNGVDLARFRPVADVDERRAARAACGVPPDAALVVSVGSVHPRKGTDLLLEAFARLAPQRPALHVAVAGPRRDLEAPDLAAFRARLEEALARSGATARAHLLGEVDDVGPLLRAADVFALPSEREGMPNAVLEAMASGLPVLLTPFAGLSADLGRPGLHFELAEREPEAFTRALARLLDDPARARALGEAARAHLEQTMDLGATLDRYAALYRALAR